MDEEVTISDSLSQIYHLKFIHGFIASISVIVVSELGDKTFFIAAIMAMRHSRCTVFTAAFFALVLMTVLSVFVGLATSFINRDIVHYASIVLFILFGLKMLKDGFFMTDEEAKDEYEGVQKELQDKEAAGSAASNSEGSINGNGISTIGPKALNTTEDPETGVLRSISSVPIGTRLKRKLMRIVSLVFIETFTMTLVAELGDRSQITTIVLAAKESTYGVTLGAILGHAMCTGIAVLGGRFVATMISVRTVTLIGGVVFLLFAVISIVIG